MKKILTRLISIALPLSLVVAIGFYFFSNKNPQISCQPGDTNADGKVNMLDLYPIALALKMYGNNVPGLVAGNFTPPLNPNQSYQRSSCGKTYPWWPGSPSSMQIDFAHADCNFDGQIDMKDVLFLKQNLNPLQFGSILAGPITGIKLKAILSTTKAYPMETYQPPVNLSGSLPPLQILTWFDISITGLPMEDSILGVVFTRTVDEAPQANNHAYRFLKVQADTSGSALSGGPKSLIGLQRAWKNIEVEYPPKCRIDSFVVTHPLDVGVFNQHQLQRVLLGEKIISCGVTIDDIMCYTNGGLFHNNGVIHQSILNAVVFTTDNQGNVQARTLDCNMDEINPSTLDLNKEVIHHKSRPAYW